MEDKEIESGIGSSFKIVSTTASLHDDIVVSVRFLSYDDQNLSKLEILFLSSYFYRGYDQSTPLIYEN